MSTKVWHPQERNEKGIRDILGRGWFWKGPFPFEPISRRTGSTKKCLKEEEKEWSRSVSKGRREPTGKKRVSAKPKGPERCDSARGVGKKKRKRGRYRNREKGKIRKKTVGPQGRERTENNRLGCRGDQLRKQGAGVEP